MNGLRVFRRELRPDDREFLSRLLAATGFFNPEELAVALELVDDRLKEGQRSHYRFLVAEEDGRVAGYSCWGPIPGSMTSADLYWLAVAPASQGHGLGRQLVTESEKWISATGRRRVYIETATRPQYAPTRAFYLSCGYHLAAELAGYYADDDGKAIFLKILK